MKTPDLHSPVSDSSVFSPKMRRRAPKTRQARDIVAALVIACGLFVLIAFLDGVARPNDISPGTALAATHALPTVDADRQPDVWAADTSAEGSRPDASH